MNAENQPVEPLLQFFAYEHLPARLQQVSKLFCDLAHAIVIDNPLPCNEERAAAIRNLLQAKDCAVRAVLFQ